MKSTNSSDETKKSLQALFVAFPSQERTSTERELVMVYLLALDGISSGIVTLACKRFIQGQVEGASLTFRPTAAEVAAECRRLQAKAFDSNMAQKLIAGPAMVPERGPRAPFIPYPKLWNALHDEPDLRKALKAMTFDGMTDISKTMAVDGIDAAKTKLRRLASAPARQKDDAA